MISDVEGQDVGLMNDRTVIAATANSNSYTDHCSIQPLNPGTFSLSVRLLRDGEIRG